MEALVLRRIGFCIDHVTELSVHSTDLEAAGRSPGHQSMNAFINDIMTTEQGLSWFYGISHDKEKRMQVLKLVCRHLSQRLARQGSKGTGKPPHALHVSDDTLQGCMHVLRHVYDIES